MSAIAHQATVAIARQGQIAIVTVDNPPVNALSQALRQGLWDAVEQLDGDSDVAAVVLHCAGRTFIAGADVREFGKTPEPPHLPDLVAHLESAKKPWIAAIHGSALGGGFEIALGCRFRLAAPTASVGLPEVNLGIIPGASGTVRTPRLIGVPAAVSLVTSGKPVRADKALKLGLIDAVIEGDLLEGAVAFAQKALSQPLPLPVSARPIAPQPDEFWAEQLLAVTKAAKGNHGPIRALQSIRHASETSFDAAMAYEAAGIPLIIVGGIEYGAGSSRDWAAKGTNLLGVKAVIAESFERIHRSNLVGMGVIPFEFTNGDNRKTLGLKGDEVISIDGLAGAFKPLSLVDCKIQYGNGQERTIQLKARVDTEVEIEYLQNGGVLQYVLRNLAKA